MEWWPQPPDCFLVGEYGLRPGLGADEEQSSSGERHVSLERETVLELSLLATAGLVVASLLLLAASAVHGRRRRAALEGRGAPEPGSVAPERHHNIAAVSVR